MTEIPQTSPEKEKKEAAVDDNARKFIVGSIDKSFLEESEASATKLIVHWLEIDEDNGIETKLAYKEKLSDGKIEILLITKTTDENGNRKTIRKDIGEEEYERRKKSLNPEDPHLEKIRWAFKFRQNDKLLDVKYDVFERSDLRMLEVEDSSEGKPFDSDAFPIELTEVSDDSRYSGYKVASIL